MVIGSLLKENYASRAIVNNVSLAPSTSESLFESMLMILSEKSESLVQYKKSLYKGIMEAAGDAVLIQESFTGFLSGVKKIIEKFLDAIKRVFSRFITMLHKIVKSDKYIIKKQNLFSKFSTDQEFDMNIFVFTVDDENVPVIDVSSLVGWSGEVAVGYHAPLVDNEVSPLEKVTARYNSLKDESGSDSYDSYRGAVINKDTISISASDFSKELFELFRNGESTAEKTTIHSGLVTEALGRFKDYEKVIKAVTSKKSEIEKKYKELSTLVKRWADNLEGKSAMNLIFGGSGLDTTNETPENKKKIDNYAQLFASLMVNRIEQMSNIHAISFAAKLDAVKERTNQDRKLLYGALSRIQKIKKTVKESYGEEDEYYEDDENEEVPVESEDDIGEEVPEYLSTLSYEEEDEYDDEDDDDEDDDDEDDEEGEDD